MYLTTLTCESSQTAKRVSNLLQFNKMPLEQHKHDQGISLEPLIIKDSQR